MYNIRTNQFMFVYNELDQEIGQKIKRSKYIENIGDVK